jgi:hypothetical protein
MDELVKHLSNIYAMDRATLAVIAVLCAISCYALKEFMVNPIMVIFVYPLVFVLSVLVQYGFILGELFQLRRIDQWLMWTVMACICGNVVGIIVVACAGRLRERVSARRQFTPIAVPRSPD